jgi:hypothetical protein
MADQKAVLRLRCHRAPFLFGPQYLATNEEWQRSFVELVTFIQADIGFKPDRIISKEEFQLCLTFGRLQFLLDADAGEFDLRELSDFEDDDLNDPSWSGLGAAPDTFFGELEEVRVPTVFQSVVHTRIKPFARELHRRMHSRFRRALSQGFAEVQARPHSPLSDFAQIDQDAFSYFVVDIGERSRGSLELDLAEGPNGERLFSVCVVPTDQALPVRKTKAREASGDARRVHNWSAIEQAADREFELAKRQPGYSVSKLYDLVGTKFEKFPAPSDFHRRLGKKYQRS